MTAQGLISGSQASLEPEELDCHAAGDTPHLLQGLNSLFQKAVLSTKPLQARSKWVCVLTSKRVLS